LPSALPVNDARRWGWLPTKPYQTSRMASTSSFTTACDMRRYVTSSSPKRTLAFICSKSANVTGDFATAAVPWV
jgi:hypothetical protein